VLFQVATDMFYIVVFIYSFYQAKIMLELLDKIGTSSTNLLQQEMVVPLLFGVENNHFSIE
jgi:hypothetical protein